VEVLSIAATIRLRDPGRHSIYLLAPSSIFVFNMPHNFESQGVKVYGGELLSWSAMTTLGSSGEQTLTNMARQLSVVESAMGQLYLAVLISRLVGFSTTTH
jgi:hypothetical protein